MKIKLLGIYQIIFGLFGIAFLIFANVKLSSTILVLIFCLLAFSVYSGCLLMQKDFRRGLDISLYNQLIQVLGFGFTGFAFQFFPAISIYLGVDITNDTKFNYGIAFGTWILNLSSNSTLFINLNIFALFLIVYILNLKKNSEKMS